MRIQALAAAEETDRRNGVSSINDEKTEDEDEDDFGTGSGKRDRSNITDLNAQL